jgi:hypothetical protein
MGVADHTVEFLADGHIPEVNDHGCKFSGLLFIFGDGLHQFDVIHPLFEMAQDLRVVCLREVVHEDDLGFYFQFCLQCGRDVL